MKRNYPRRCVLAMSLLGSLSMMARADAPENPPAATTTNDVIQATDTAALKAAAGKETAVEGNISRTYKPKSGIVLLDFVGTRDFTGFIAKKDADAIDQAFDGNLEKAIKGKTVTITGKIKLFHDKPEIAITSADQIKVESNKKPDAKDNGSTGQRKKIDPVAEPGDRD